MIEGEVTDDVLTALLKGRIVKKALGEGAAHRCLGNDFLKILNLKDFGWKMRKDTEHLRSVKRATLILDKIKKEGILVRVKVQIDLDNHTVAVKFREARSCGAREHSADFRGRLIPLEHIKKAFHFHFRIPVM